MEGYLPGAVLIGAAATVLLLRLAIDERSQTDRGWLLIILGAVSLAAPAGVLVGMLIR
jgi:hypothetical protein